MDNKDLQHILSVSGLQEIVYENTYLRDENIQKLCEKLKVDEKKKLVLSGNDIKIVGVKAIASLLQEQNSLIHLSLEWNQIDSTGAEYLAEALVTNRSLVHLDLRSNYINSEGAIAFANAIMRNPILKTLDLRWNRIEDRGALAFKSCILERKPSLQLLIHGNLLSEATFATINEWLKKGLERDSLIDESLYRRPQEELPPRNVTIELLNKEIFQLRQQLNQHQLNENDLQRQLDGALMKITELEQKLDYEKHENLSLTEANSQLNLRLSMRNDEIVNLTNAFERERASIMNEMLRTVTQKENEIRELALERDTFKEQCMKLTDQNEQFKIQHEHIKQQLENDRAIALNELTLAHQRINDFTIAETNLKAENTSLKTTNIRLTDKIRILEEELQLTRQEKDKLLQEEHDHYLKEIEKLKNEHRLLMINLHEKNAQQTDEILRLQDLIAKLRDQFIQERKELVDAYEISINKAKEMERQKLEHIINEMRIKIETLTNARNELESRCENYTREIQKMQEENSRALQNLQYQLSSLQEELQRQRSTNHSLQLANNQLENSKQTLEMLNRDNQKKLSQYEEKQQQLQKDVHSLLLQKQNLQSLHDTLSINYEKLRENRYNEYQIIHANVMNAVKNEFDNMKLHFNIQPISQENQRTSKSER